MNQLKREELTGLVNRWNKSQGGLDGNSIYVSDMQSVVDKECEKEPLDVISETEKLTKMFHLVYDDSLTDDAFIEQATSILFS